MTYPRLRPFFLPHLSELASVSPFLHPPVMAPVAFGRSPPPVVRRVLALNNRMALLIRPRGDGNTQAPAARPHVRSVTIQSTVFSTESFLCVMTDASCFIL
jgi:hypothetical protein